MKKVNKVVLAYSGGLDTSVILKWLKENYQCEVVTFTADLGQEEDFNAVEAKAKQQGTSDIFIENLKQKFIMIQKVQKEKFLNQTGSGQDDYYQAGIMMAQAMRIYKTALNENEFIKSVQNVKAV